MHNNNIISFVLRGTSFHALGTYTLTLWMNKSKKGQTMLDKRDAFALVRYTDQEEDSDDSIIRTDSSLNLTGELSYVVTDYQPIIDSYVTEEELTSTLIDYVKVDDISIFNNDFVVTITKWGNTYQADKTVPEINAAFDAGMNVYAKYHNNPWDTAFYMTARRSGNGAYIIYMSIYYGITLGEDKELLDKGVQYLLQTNSGIKQYSCNFNDYVSKTIFDSSLQNYYTKAEIDEMLNQIRNT